MKFSHFLCRELRTSSLSTGAVSEMKPNICSEMRRNSQFSNVVAHFLAFTQWHSARNHGAQDRVLQKIVMIRCSNCIYSKHDCIRIVCVRIRIELDLGQIEVKRRKALVKGYVDRVVVCLAAKLLRDMRRARKSFFGVAQPLKGEAPLQPKIVSGNTGPDHVVQMLPLKTLPPKEPGLEELGTYFKTHLVPELQEAQADDKVPASHYAPWWKHDVLVSASRVQKFLKASKGVQIKTWTTWR